jgi:predicted RNA-binding Zn-ribbon protein involved in translation (DUF1610 family)
MTLLSEVACPECGVSEDEYLDYWIGSDGVWHFNCFECGAEWTIKHSELEKG